MSHAWNYYNTHAETVDQGVALLRCRGDQHQIRVDRRISIPWVFVIRDSPYWIARLGWRQWRIGSRWMDYEKAKNRWWPFGLTESPDVCVVSRDGAKQKIFSKCS